MLFLKQSTAVTVKIGPFVDETDGKTAETGLTISQADVRLSKNGGNIAQKNDANAATHDEIGVYDCALDTTDTNTLGRLQLWVHESGALPVWHEFMVLPANTYDSLIGGGDYLQVDTVQIEGSDATNQINAEADAALADYDPPTNAEMEARTIAAANYATAANLDTVDTVVDSILEDIAVIGAAGAGLTALPWNAAWDAEVQSECADALNAYDPPTNAEMEARTIAAANYATAAALATVDGIVDKLDTALELDGDVYRFTENALEQAPSGSGLDAAGVRAAIGMAAADLDDQLDAIAAAIALIDSSAGSGAIAHTVTLQDAGENPVIDADVWITTNASTPGANIVASGSTDGNGQVTFYLDAGTYYLWAQKPGTNFTNPTEFEVSE